MLTFAHMLRKIYIILLTGVLITLGLSNIYAQEQKSKSTQKTFARKSIYKGDTILWVELKPLYVYKPLQFKNKRQ